MAAVFANMSEDGYSSAKCRESRRRRIEMRRLSTVAGESTTLTSISVGSDLKGEAEASDLASAEKRRRTIESDPLSPQPSIGGGGGGGTHVLPLATGSDPVLGFGSVALSGRSREMEDAVSVVPCFFRPAGGSPFHFFGVFDGHGGAHVSELCKERMHELMADDLTRTAARGEMDEEALKAAVRRCYGRMDELALLACACGRIGAQPCTCDRSGFESEIVGSTAVVAVVGSEWVVVANCGDSRAVLSRGGRALPVSDDDKPDRPDELARIEAAGGRVIYLNGARVNGILAMSRAIGDKYFKPVVIPEPEVRVMERHPEDECLVIASDGLWDVIPNELACDIARRCLEEGNREGSYSGSGGEEHPSQARCNLATALLARLALGRKSCDNISVIVVDLRRGQA